MLIRLFRSACTHGLLLAVIVVSLTGVCRTGCAQEKEPVDVLRVNTDLVVFDAQVIDKKTRRVIGDLTKDDFEVTENGVKQSVSYFSRDELPLSILLLLDVSRSVRPILHQIRDGALNALQRLKPEDQVAVMAFAEIPSLAQDFTKDRALVARKIEEVTASEILGYGTFLPPALERAALHMRRAPTQTSRRVIIVITDNIAGTIGHQEKDVLELLFNSGTMVYGLIVRAAIGKVFNILFLGQIKGVNKYVEETGGEMIGADKEEVGTKLGVVIDRLRARYALGFRPTKTDDDEKFRPIKIKVSIAKKRKEKPVVLTKKGYYLRRR